MAHIPALEAALSIVRRERDREADREIRHAYNEAADRLDVLLSKLTERHKVEASLSRADRFFAEADRGNHEVALRQSSDRHVEEWCPCSACVRARTAHVDPGGA